MDKSAKGCFGVLDKVFPPGPDGLREVVTGCFDCPVKRECLQSALCTKEGMTFRAELLERNPATGIAGRIRRWSEMKDLNRRMKEEERRR